VNPSLSRPASVLIPVGVPWRLALRRPVFGTLLLAGCFFLCTAPVKETPVLFNHAPWLNDPFDTVISFMMFLVPLIAVLCVPRVLLCRRSQPLLAARIADVLRGCRVVLAGISVTLLAEWLSVAIRDNRAQWNQATGLQIGLLILLTTADAAMIWQMHHVRLPLPTGHGAASRPGAGQDSQLRPDWLTDFFLFADQHSRLLGPASRPARRLLSWGQHRLAEVFRRHPVWTALAACTAFGTGVGVTQGIREGYYLPVTAVAVVLLTVGMFGLLTAAGSYLGLVRSNSPLSGQRRRLVDAAVITCIGVLIPFALRYHLWWLVGSNNSAAGLSQLLQLLAVAAVAIFSTAYMCGSLWRMHRDHVRERKWP
jgi:hypothetical protein